MTRIVVAALSVFLLIASAAGAHRASQQATPQRAAPFEPKSGQPGKDATWVPTRPEVLDKMLDMAAVTASDFVIDLGSGDGRTVIAAARRGARALGVEYNHDLVELSRRRAKEAGVAGRATFVEGDMFAADISKATVLALFLTPENLYKLQDKFLALRPGTRIVLNSFPIGDWEPDATEVLGSPCTTWCTALLFIVPARVGGVWRSGDAELNLKQTYQMLSGTLTRSGMTAKVAGRLRGDRITLASAETQYTGSVAGDRIAISSTTGGKMNLMRNARQ